MLTTETSVEFQWTTQKIQPSDPIMVAGYEDVVYIILVTRLGVVVTKEFK
jgi:hypothetical protein